MGGEDKKDVNAFLQRPYPSNKKNGKNGKERAVSITGLIPIAQAAVLFSVNTSAVSMAMNRAVRSP